MKDKRDISILHHLLSGSYRAFEKNLFLLVLVLLSFVLAATVHQPVKHFASYVDWKTIYTLTGLLILTMGIKESGFFRLTAIQLSRKIRNERYLALFLIFLSALLSAFFTNDIALFIIVPLTLGLKKILEKGYSKIIIFEAIGVNAGSALTPIGNPQNIFLWHHWNISFLNFIKELTPLFLITMLWLFLFVWVTLPSKKIKTNRQKSTQVNRKLFFVSLTSLIVFIFFIEVGYGAWALPVIFLIYLLFYEKVLIKSDWALLLLFIFVFIDIGLICQAPVVQRFLTELHLGNSNHLFWAGILSSQAISNVPTAILLSHYTLNHKILAWAVNIGGNGLLISSFANLIALRFLDSKTKYVQFHLYSLSFLLVTAVSIWFIFIK